MTELRPVVVLGAGINGAALARELLLNRVPVWLVDVADVASGTTSYSSRLIHGGLRYLEYGEFSLVNESLAERGRLLSLAPHLVRPLRLFIPIRSRFGGLTVALRRFLGSPVTSPTPRGLWLIQAGLWFYDRYARSSSLPTHSVTPATTAGQPAIDSGQYPWTCAYSDAQVAFPERFTWVLVEDSQRVARERGVEFRLWNYHRAALEGSTLTVTPTDAGRPYDTPQGQPVARVNPSFVVNATGAWVDRTLHQLQVPSPPLLACTRGTHLFTRLPALREQLQGQAIYGEADDGRPVFILPLVDGTLIGTTDDPFSGPPEAARATLEDREYLVRQVNTMLPGQTLTAADLVWQSSGVRPLPRSSARTTSSITRRHFLVEHLGGAVPLASLVGGKLTTCRSLAEEATGQILRYLGWPHDATSRNRPLPGSDGYPDTAEALRRRHEQLSRTYSLPLEQIERIWLLQGTRTEAILSELAESSDSIATPLFETIPGTGMPTAFVRWVIENESVQCLDDLVERRLMLLLLGAPTESCLNQLADLLILAGRLTLEDKAAAVARTGDRLQHHFQLALRD